MEYKGYDVKVVQITSERKYRWTVDLGGKSKTGIGITKAGALASAKTAIDKFIAKKQ
jgi:hypothetical protein